MLQIKIPSGMKCALLKSRFCVKFAVVEDRGKVERNTSIVEHKFLIPSSSYGR